MTPSSKSRSPSADRTIHQIAVDLLSTLRGYSETEIEAAIVEGTDDYDSAIASDIASITSALRDAAEAGA